MKTTNTKLLAGAILLLSIAIVISSFKSGDGSKKYTTMIVAKLGMKSNLSITIVGDKEQTAPIEGESNVAYDNIIKNAKMVNETINKLSADGYHLVQIVPETMITYYLFEKTN